MPVIKTCRMLLAIAALGALAQVSDAGCNCSVPPSPAVYPAPIPATNTAPPLVQSAAPWANAGMYGNSPGSLASSAYGTLPQNYADYTSAGPHWAPGGYEGRVGSPVYYHDPAGGQYVVTGNPYYDHFGPGFHRSSLQGHYRFPYYNYRAPWYYPGKAVYNRDTNYAW